MEQEHPILIVGAGPAGLALGVELKRRSVGFFIVERGERPADSWRRMPTRLKLVSPWKANWLPGAQAQDFPSNAEISRDDYHRWLQEYARAEGLPIQTGVEVHRVSRRADGGFRVETSRGEIFSRLLVSATGCFSNPFTPEISGARASGILQRHTADYRDAETLRAAIGKSDGRVLIVGRRMSAGQTLVELSGAGFRVALSSRAPIRFGSGPLGWWIFFRIHPWLEARKLKRGGAAARGFEARMPGGRARRLLERGAVRTFPRIARFEDAAVVFEDGQRWQPDAVIYATGFRPALRHLTALGLALNGETGRPELREMESARRSARSRR